MQTFKECKKACIKELNRTKWKYAYIYYNKNKGYYFYEPGMGEQNDQTVAFIDNSGRVIKWFRKK